MSSSHSLNENQNREAIKEKSHMEVQKNTQKNMVKYEIYKTMHDNLNKAMKAGFYYEAIFIEYAIFEDRLTSLLKHAGVPYANKNGKEDKISRKIDKIRSRPEFTTKFVRERLSLDLVEEIQAWTEQRNAFIHNLANTPYDSEQVKQVAKDGERILKVFKTKSSSVINRFKKDQNEVKRELKS